jgi:hypothetical protein
MRGKKRFDRSAIEIYIGERGSVAAYLLLGRT